MHPGNPGFNPGDFYKRYTLIVWLGIIYAASLAVIGEGILTIIYYSYLIIFTGKMFFDYISRKDFINIWLASASGAAIIYSLFGAVMPSFPSEGLVVATAAGGALGLLAAVATYMPNAPMRLFMLGPFPFKYLAIGLIVLDIFSSGTDVQAAGTGVAHFAHLFGVGLGFAYIYLRQKGMRTDKIFGWFYRSSRPKMKAKKGGKQHKKPPADDQEYNKQKAEEQEKINQILDKISKSGYDSLTKKEKELLFRQSKH